MHPVINHLLQLQELNLIRDEQKVVSITGKRADSSKTAVKHLQQLDASIKNMTEELPDDIRVAFEKLNKKDHIVMASISADSCSVCGMKIPISLAQAVRMGKKIIRCPNCARILYSPEFTLRRITEGRRRNAPPKIGISRFSSYTLMIPRLKSINKEDAIQELGYKMEQEGFVDNGDKLVEEALKREAILSTAVDNGLAFPHVRGVEGGGLALALGISKRGINFNGPDTPLTHIIFFIVIPTAVSAFYLKLLAGLTETFMKADARKAIMTENDQKNLWKVLLKTTKAFIK